MSDKPLEIKVMPSPRHVDIAITGRCNLACQYCFYADEMTARSDLSTDTWLKLFEELGRLGVMTVCLTGGEVFTRSDLFELIDGVIANKMRYSLLSNGTLITEKTLEKFGVGKRFQRLDSIQISVDGSNSEVHDRSRPKSFELAIRGLKLLKEADYPLFVRVTINRFNVNDLENLATMLLDEVGLPSFSTNEAYPCGATERADDGIMLTPEQRALAMQTLTQLTERYRGRINAQAGPQVFARELKKIDELLKVGKKEIPGRGALTGCGGVFSKLAVLHDGTIVPCHVLSSLHLGVIGKDNLQEIWLCHPTMLALRTRRAIPLESLETCQDCTYQGFCTGGCPGGALHVYGNFNSRNPFDCFRVLKGEDPSFVLPEKSFVELTNRASR